VLFVLHLSKCESAAVKIGKKTSETTNFLNSIQREIDSLKSIWEGKAAEAYVEQFMALRKELENQAESMSVRP